MTSSSHSGVNTDDRAYLVQQVAGLTGLQAPDAERRVDALIADAKTAIGRARRNSIIVAFSIAAATLIGAAVAWAAAVAGGRHRDGEPLPNWMARLEPLPSQSARDAGAVVSHDRPGASPAVECLLQVFSSQIIARCTMVCTAFSISCRLTHSSRE